MTDNVPTRTVLRPQYMVGENVGSTTIAVKIRIIQSPEPNRDTIEAIREIESGNTVECKDEGDFFRQLHS